MNPISLELAERFLTGIQGVVGGYRISTFVSRAMEGEPESVQDSL